MPKPTIELPDVPNGWLDDPARADGAPLPVTYQSNQYDRAATQRLVDAFRSTGQVGAIYFNDPQISDVQALAGHDNHLHVKLRP